MMALTGLAVILLGFVLRLQPLLVIVIAAGVTGLGAGMAPLKVLGLFGHSFNESRYIIVLYVILPLIGLLERHGLQVRARAMVARFRRATLARLLIVYLGLRQVSAGLGLISIAGQAQTVRPLLAPMAEEAAARDAGGPLDPAERDKVRALAAATDNIGLLFGEDIFLAIGSILLMKGFLEQSGIIVEPLALSLWAIPTAIAAFLIHGGRLWLIGRRRRQ